MSSVCYLPKYFDLNSFIPKETYTIIFMSAYDTIEYSKSKSPHFDKKQGLDMLLNKHHLTYMLIELNRQEKH